MGNSARRIPNKPETVSEDENEKAIPYPRPGAIVEGGGGGGTLYEPAIEQTNFWV